MRDRLRLHYKLKRPTFGVGLDFVDERGRKIFTTHERDEVRFLENWCYRPTRFYDVESGII